MVLFFLHFFQDYKASAGGTPSVWKVFGRVYKSEIIECALTRLIYDVAVLVGPLALNGVVAYAIDYGQPNEVT